MNEINPKCDIIKELHAHVLPWGSKNKLGIIPYNQNHNLPIPFASDKYNFKKLVEIKNKTETVLSVEEVSKLIKCLLLLTSLSRGSRNINIP